MCKEQLKNWFKAALIRALRTFAQTAAATIGAAALISDVSWVQVLSLLMSVGGLPEVKEGE